MTKSINDLLEDKKRKLLLDYSSKSPDKKLTGISMFIFNLMSNKDEIIEEEDNTKEVEETYERDVIIWDDSDDSDETEDKEEETEDDKS